jgi:hypothetical protein
MNKRKQKSAAEIAKTYTLSRIERPGVDVKPGYIATVGGVDFVVGCFATVEEAVAAADANLADYLTRLEPKPAYRVQEIGTVTVDTGTIVILDPCRIESIAATQDHDNLIGSPLYPDRSIKPGWRVDDVTEARQILEHQGCYRCLLLGVVSVTEERRFKEWVPFGTCPSGSHCMIITNVPIPTTAA